MLPIRSNTAEQGCTPVSSNCVTWQGPVLPCISLCNGDTISDVVYKVAVQLCSIQTTLELTDLDLSQLVSFCNSTNPAPTTQTLSAVLEFIIDKIACLNDAIQNPPPSSGYTEPNLNLPSCLQYTDPGNGQLVTQLTTSNFVLRLGTQFCSLKATVDQHTSQINNINNTLAQHSAAISNLQTAALPTVTPNCVMPATPTAMNEVLAALESQFCQLRTQITGSNSSALITAIAQQCTGLSSLPALGQSGTMSSITGWNTTVTNLAQSFQNMWLTICDMRTAMNDLKNCCGSADCSQFVLDFTTGINNDRTEVTLFFVGSTVIPNGYDNCNQLGSKVTIKDSANNTFVGYVDLVAASTNQSGVSFTVSGNNLNPSLTYTVIVEGCVVKDGQTCSKTVTKTINPPCAVVQVTGATVV